MAASPRCLYPKIRSIHSGIRIVNRGCTMQVLTNIVTLESFTMSLNEDFWITLRPRWKDNRINNFAVILLHTEIKAVVVGEKAVQVKEFWDQFSNVCHIIS